MFKTYTDYNFQGNQLLNVVIHTADAHPTTPTPVNGQLYYNTTQKSLFSYDATLSKWRKIGSDSTTLNNGKAIQIDSVVNTDTLQTEHTINVNVNDAFLVIETYTDGGVEKSRVSIKDLGVTEGKLAASAVSTTKIKDANVTTVKIADKAITLTKMADITAMSVIGNMTSATGAASAIKVLTSLTGSITPSDLINAEGVKAYIDSSLANLGTLKGGFDANTSTTLPGSAANNTTKLGDYWYVTVAGSITANSVTETFNVGDVIIANKNSPTNNFNDYIRLESNRDAATTTTLGLVTLATQAQVLAGTGTGVVTAVDLHARTATETRTGLVELATAAEALAGTDATRVITPATLKGVISGNSKVFTIGDGTNSTYTITHSLGSKNLHVSFYDSDNIMVNCGVTDITTTTFKCVVKPIPTAAAQITVVVTKVI